jgi:hypothetical protein
MLDFCDFRLLIRGIEISWMLQKYTRELGIRWQRCGNLKPMRKVRSIGASVGVRGAAGAGARG